MSESGPEILIIKRKSSHEEGHHGGAWKIAFADFMTAMMAFFLVLWIINATDKDTKTVIARYFNPVKLENPARARKGVHGVDTSKVVSNETQGDQAPGALPSPSAASAAEQGAGPTAAPAGGAAPKKDERPKPSVAAHAGPRDAADVKPTMTETALFSDPYQNLDRIAKAGSAPEPSVAPDTGKDEPTRESGSTSIEAFRDPFKPIGPGAVTDSVSAESDVPPLTAPAADQKPDLGPPKKATDKRNEDAPPAASAAAAGVPGPLPSPSIASQGAAMPPAKIGAANGVASGGPATGAATGGPTNGAATGGPTIGAATGGPATGPTSGGPSAGAATGGPTTGAATGGPATGAATGGPSSGTVAGAAAAAAAAQIMKDLQVKLAGLEKSAASPAIDVKATDDGLLISLTDRLSFSMFAVGSAEPRPQLIEAMDAVAQVLKTHPGQLVLRGHTDGRPYKTEAYDNWRLSSARAQMAYYMLARAGIPESRIDRVEGHADRALRDTAHPLAAENRRIEILLRGLKP